MFNYKIIIQYDGTKYKGWQKLKGFDDTIQGKLINVISKNVGYEVDIIGSGRTDAGVHALGQVANFHLEEEIKDLHRFLDDVNKYLPKDIAVIDIKKVDDRFHARYSAVSKTYVYRIHLSNISNVFERKYVYDCPGIQLDVESMRLAAAVLTGKHDFKSFTSNKHMKKSSVRNIMRISIVETDSELRIEYTADGFLQNMVRILTGTLIEIGNGTKNISDLEGIMNSKDRANAGFMAPAEGLCLKEIKY